MTATRVIIWRHGQTRWNAAGRIQGQADVPLDETGWRQTRAAAATIALSKPTAVFSSDMKRAHAAAQAVADLTGLEVTVDKRLREIDAGDWEGLTFDDIDDRDLEMIERGQEPGEDFRRSESGETAGEAAARVAEALSDIVLAQPDDATVAVAMHGEAAQVGIAQFLEIEKNRLGEMLHCAWANLERISTGYWILRQYNATVPDMHDDVPNGLIS